ncbi:hypothetical protein KIS4809_3868 [Bacillus sp. ZZV12-4809]|nr:hypothetical protein KIS4809_3868 [Bacillus sp. ZZV12-4809]
MDTGIRILPAAKAALKPTAILALHFKGTILIVHIKYNVNCYFKNDERG